MEQIGSEKGQIRKGRKRVMWWLLARFMIDFFESGLLRPIFLLDAVVSISEFVIVKSNRILNYVLESSRLCMAVRTRFGYFYITWLLCERIFFIDIIFPKKIIYNLPSRLQVDILTRNIQDWLSELAFVSANFQVLYIKLPLVCWKHKLLKGTWKLLKNFKGKNLNTTKG